VPFALLSAAQANSDVNETLNSAASLIGTCFGFIGAIYGIIAGMMVEAAVGRFAASGQIGEALRVGAVWRMVRAKPGMYLIVLLLSVLLIALLTSLGAIACGIGAAFGAAYGALINAHLQGQAYRYVTAQPGR
jgi:hypothetical protein